MKKVFNIRIEEELLKQFQELAAKDSRTASSLITKLIADYVKSPPIF